MENTKMYLNATEVATCMQISVPLAYKIIRRLNTELTAMGYLVVAGRVNRRYFEEKIYGGYTA